MEESGHFHTSATLPNVRMTNTLVTTEQDAGLAPPIKISGSVLSCNKRNINFTLHVWQVLPFSQSEVFTRSQIVSGEF